ncbi:MAG TPA: c-type cytochrome [Candidatus Limnocylindrales bacterium]|nr:c-type cytochrome [Candidatus Limnocylindrales bacterium]
MAATAVITAACEREERGFRVEPPQAQLAIGTRLTPLQPGSPMPTPSQENEYEKNAFAMNEGKRLFQWYNCSGCHAQGGGGMGPALMDDKWIYGSQPDQIFSTIVEGRPNGMPSFGGKIPDFQVWQLAAYVRSMSGNVDQTAAPSRSDSMQVKVQEQLAEEVPPADSAPPPQPQ